MSGPSENLIAAYEQCLAEKRHYDSLAWTIGAIVLVFVGALFAYIPQLQGSSYWFALLKRLPLAVFGTVLASLWLFIYERNRFYAEVANERARDFEKELSLCGVAHAEMEGTLLGRVVLKNKTGGLLRTGAAESSSPASSSLKETRCTGLCTE